MIEISSISKSYDKTTALNSISLRIETGELFGLIGPDGAGKTTLMRILMSLILPDEGSASMMGYDVIKDYKQLRHITGYMPGRFSLYHDLTVAENLQFFATVFGTTVEENYDQIKDIYIQIEPFRDRRAGKLSGGMKQKLALSCALIHKPRVLILDEQTTGVDAVSRKEFWEMLGRLRDDGISILVSTPYMDEADRCDRIALIQNGQILGSNTPEKLKQTFTGKLWSLRTNSLFASLKIARTIPQISSVHSFGQFLHLTTSENLSMDELEKELNDFGIDSFELKSIQASTEDIFMQKMSGHEQ
jgi:ABC-2 type transport system ATP-binding protein